MTRAVMPRTRDQQGFSLIEVLVALAVVAALLVPLSAWTLLAIRQQPVVQDDLTTTSSQGLLGIHLPNDARMAAAAAYDENNDEVEFTDCLGGPGGDGTQVKLVLVIADVEPRKVVYKEAALREGGEMDPVRRSIWRRECPLNDQWDTSATEVLTDVEPGAARADCPPAGPSAICRYVRFQVGDDADAFELRVTRRVDAASLRFDRTGNRIPVAKISVLSQAGEGPFFVTLSPEGSDDPDGEIVQYRWTIPETPYVEGASTTFEERLDPEDPDNDTALGAQQVVEWAEPGIYFVQLTVVDDEDAEATTYKRVVVGRAGVVADVRVEPEVGEAELTEFAFLAQWAHEETGEPTGSGGPPGRTLEYEWVIRSPLPDPFDEDGNLLDPPPAPEPNTRFTTTRPDPGEFMSALPSSMIGLVEVELTVSDTFEPDVSDTVVYPIQLTEPSDTFELPEFDEPVPDAPTAAGTVTVTSQGQGSGGGAQRLEFDAQDSQPGPEGDALVDYRWDFGPTLPTLQTAEAALDVSSFLPGGGTFEWVLTVTDAAGRIGRTSGMATRDAPLASAPVLGFGDGRISWDEVPGARGYRTEYVFDACGAAAPTLVAEGYRTGTMSAPVPPSLCSQPGPIRARVVALRLDGDTVVEEVASNEVAIQTELLAVAGGPE